jgi:CMP-N-acetylneuraminic acid synthetase
MNSIVALIPARSGSVRIKDKNIKPLGGLPLMAWTIKAAIKSGIFDDVVVSSDSRQYGEIAQEYGAHFNQRPTALAGSMSQDYGWVEWTLRTMHDDDRRYDAFAILRPTSPFRTAETIRRAWDEFGLEIGIDSLRAVERVKQHPGKMWVVRSGRMLPLLPLSPADAPWHSQQYASLPEVFVQNASLEIAWTRTVWRTKTIAGGVIVPFLTHGWEGFDLNDLLDWQIAEAAVASGKVTVP